MSDYNITLTAVTSGCDGATCWVHPRAGALPAERPGEPPTAVLTTQKLLLSGSDVFYAIHSCRSSDGAETWSALEEQTNFRRIPLANGIEKTVCDFTPKWHAATGRLLGMGLTVYYENNAVMRTGSREAAYAAYDAERHAWRDWRELELPDEERFRHAGAGCAQRHDLPDGNILLPISCRLSAEPRRMATTVLRCAFDGETLRFIEQGNELSVPEKRGLYEASLTRFGGRFYLTMRNDLKGYVSAGDDGLHFAEQKAWTFDDGEALGNYNTQQHWVTRPDALHLVYTRKGLNNDHVFRHRAPLVMAQVDTDRLCVIRETERVLVPERGARLGNFGVTDVSDSETWVTVAEWMQPAGCEQHGSDNTLWVARLTWG